MTSITARTPIILKRRNRRATQAAAHATVEILVVSFLILFALGAQAQGALGTLGQQGDVLGIAAVVNDEVISRYDLDQRVGLVMATAGIPPTPENVNRIQSQVLRGLVDERLQLQEARRLEIEVTEEEISEALERIAARNDMTPEDIEEYLSDSDVSILTLRTQLVSDLAWNKVVSRRFGPLVQIGDDEISEVISRLEADANKPTYLVSEVLLTFDNPSQEAEILDGASRLVEQLRQGAPFPAVAQQFSQSSSAATGGDIGWVQAGQLQPTLTAALEGMQIGAISDPIRSVNGVYILQLRSKKEGLGPDPMRSQLQLAKIVFPLAPTAPDSEVRRLAGQAQQFVREFKSCARLDEMSNLLQGANVSPPRNVAAGQLQPELRQAVMSREAGDVLPPVRSPEGIELLAICDRKDDQGGLPTRDSIEDNLFAQQLSMMARRHLRDLRRDAVVETR